MDIPFSIPPPLVPLFIGLIALAIGAWLIETANLVVRLIGLVVALGGMTFLLTPIPNDWVSPGIKAIVVTVVFIGLSAAIARSGGPKNRAATIIGVVLTVLGVLALIVQLGDYATLPGGTVQNLIEQGFEALSRIFNLSSKAID